MRVKVGQPSSYSSKLSKSGVIEVVNNNKRLIEPYSDLVNDTFENYRSDISPSWDPFSQQENDDVENELSEINEQTEIKGQDIDNWNNQSSQLQATILSDSELIVKLELWTLNKDKYLTLYLIGLSYKLKLSLGLFQISQSHFICFLQAVEAVVNHI